MTTAAPRRRVDITSDSTSANTSAQYQILEVSQGSENVNLEMLVPNQMVSALIGKQGANIKQVTAATGVNVQFAKEHEIMPGCSERVLTISGPLAQVSSAQNMMSDRVVELLESQGGVMGGAAHSMPPPSAAPPPGPGMQQMAYMQQMPYMNQYAPPMPPQPQQMDYNAYAPPQSMPSAPPPVGMQQARPPATMGGAEESHLTVLIPSSMVGRLIGKGGAGIKEVIHSCGGVDIQVAKTDEVETALSEMPMRSIAIRGTSTAAWSAQNFLLMRLQAVSGQGNWNLQCTPSTPLVEV